MPATAKKTVAPCVPKNDRVALGQKMIKCKQQLLVTIA